MHRDCKARPGNVLHCFLLYPLASHMATMSCKGGQIMCDEEDDKNMDLINFSELQLSHL